MGRIYNKGTINNKSKIKIKPAEKTRKQLRKEKRQQKKISRTAYYQKKKLKNQSEKIIGKSTFNSEKINNNKLLTKEEKKVNQTLLMKAQKRQKPKDITERRAEKNRKKQKIEQLKQANIEEDKMIKQLEKRLKLNKRKNKSIPKFFVSDGLDYLLDLCDSENRSRMVETEKQLLETAFQFPPEDEVKNENKKYDKQDSTDDGTDSEQDMENENILFNSDENSENLDETENEKSNYSDASECSNDSKDLWEDIYGRQRDKKGNIISKKYLPPAVRAVSTDTSVTNENIRRLERHLKGILNRLAEQNMHTIANQVEEMYMSNSRNDMNVMLCKLIMESIVAPVLTPDRLISEHMMLIAILHANIGVEVGAHFLLTFVKILHQMLNEFHNIENKKLDNLILMISHLYNFKVYGHRLLYQILEKLAEKFTEKKIELILLILKTVGFLLRKDDPLALKELILNLQQKATNVIQENSRIKFLLDTLLAIKNNNMNKIPQYDPTRIEHLKKILKNFIRKGNSVTQFNVTLEDLLEADERGKWWVVGSAWSGLKDIGQDFRKLDKISEYSEEILELARKQRMNTNIRRDIFCVLMTAEDYLDAFEKIHHLALNNQQQKEVIYVILNCCIQEKKFNPYYAVLAQKLCNIDRKYQLTIQYALWDKLKTLNDLNTKQLTNLTKFLTHLFLEKALPLSVLKVIEFTELDKQTMRLVQKIMLGILLHKNEEACFEVFDRISLYPKLQNFRESLRLFVNNFILKHICNDVNDRELLQKRAEWIDKILITRESKLIF